MKKFTKLAGNIHLFFNGIVVCSPDFGVHSLVRGVSIETLTS
jgi:hypothetical protein